MDTFTRDQHEVPVKAVPLTDPPATAVAHPVAPERVRTCSHCQYDGPLQVRRTYPLMLRWYMIAVGFALGILPGVLLLSWRRSTPSTLALTCPLCLFLHLEPAATPKS